MKISVVIPCYNAQRYLEACLESVLMQSVRDIEVIIVDDGSTDDTLDIAQALQQKDTRIRVIHQENAGVSAARNRALDVAQGEWITFVDSDDVLVEGALEAMLDVADDHADLIVCAHETFDELGQTQSFFPEGRWPNLHGEAQRRAAVLRLIEGDSVLNIMCNKLHRRALIEREQIRLHTGLKIAEDALFNLEAVLCGNGIRYVPLVTYRYRTHAASAMHMKTAGEFDTHAPWFAAVRALLEKRGCLERYYPAYLNSVVLRLYKDGGVPGVLRGFGPKARPYLQAGQVDKRKLSIQGRVLLFLCETDTYPAIYPLIVPFQVIGRKIREAADRLSRKERGA